jgi:hypothetical protein
MAPVYHRFSALAVQNSTISYNSIVNPPFSAPIRVTLFFVSVCVVHAMTAHVPIPECIEDSFGRGVSMVLGPVGSGISSFNSIVVFAMKIGRGDWPSWRYQRNNSSLADAISASALAIRIPIRFTGVTDDGPFGWRRVKKGIPVNDGAEHDSRQSFLAAGTPENNTVLCSLPPICRITTNSLKLFPSSNKLNTAFAILQLIYSVIEAYVQYEPMIRNQGLSSPFIIAVAYLYMSFINLIANLVQGSYTHITIIPPKQPPAETLNGSSTNAETTETYRSHVDARESSETTTTSVRMQQTASTDVTQISDRSGDFSIESEIETGDTATSNVLEPQHPTQDRTEEFQQWLVNYFPQIEFEEYSSLTSIAFFMHFSFALVVILIWIGLLTDYKAGSYPSQVFLLLAVIMDPVVHFMLAVVQALNRRRGLTKEILRGLGEAGIIKVIGWIFNLIGCYYAAVLLFQIYEGIIFAMPIAKF